MRILWLVVASVLGLVAVVFLLGQLGFLRGRAPSDLTSEPFSVSGFLRYTLSPQRLIKTTLSSAFRLEVIAKAIMDGV